MLHASQHKRLSYCKRTQHHIKEMRYFQQTFAIFCEMLDLELFIQ